MQPLWTADMLYLRVFVKPETVVDIVINQPLLSRAHRHVVIQGDTQMVPGIGQNCAASSYSSYIWYNMV